MYSKNASEPHGSSRRDLLKGLAALGAGALLPYDRGRAQAPAAENRRIIDVHQHFVSPDYLALLMRKRMGGGPQWKDYSPAMHVENMDKAGILTSMVSPTAPAVWFGDIEESRKAAREINEYAAAKMVGAYKGRFGLYAALPFPDVEGSLKEIEYAFDTLHADGIAVLTSYDNKMLGDKAFAPLFDELNRRKAVVYTHPLALACCGTLVEGVTPQILEYPSDTTRAIMSLIVSGTATRCPDIKFIFSHAGGTLTSIAGRFLGPAGNGDALAKAAEPNSRLYHLRRFYYDTAQSTNPPLMQALKLLVPTSQIVFGTDFPFANGGAQLAGLQSCGLSAAELRGIYRDNAIRMMPQYA
jgi:predicted TIM-barrel fold metal-dependent hydrolase